MFLKNIKKFLYKQTFDIKIYKKKLKIKNLKKELDGLTICHMTDFHFTDYLKINKNLKNIISKLKADLFFLTGDFVDDDSGIKYIYKYLNNLNSKYGSFAVLGNHDYYFYNNSFFMHNTHKGENKINQKELLNELKRSNIKLLIDQTKSININGYKLNITGIDNFIIDDYDFKKLKNSLKKINISYDYKAFNILLSHSPDVAKFLDKDRYSLIFAGHTHGGQVIVPYIGAFKTNSIITKRTKSYGIFRQYNHTIILNPGIGVGKNTNLRINCKPMIYMIKLAKI